MYFTLTSLHIMQDRKHHIHLQPIQCHLYMLVLTRTLQLLLLCAHMHCIPSSVTTL
jgi:hypothetical protein